MNSPRSVLLSLTLVAGCLLPTVPSNASELVKLGRLLVTGKRAPTPAPLPVAPALAADEAKPAKPTADGGDRPVLSSGRHADALSNDARESTGNEAADRPAAERKTLDRGQIGASWSGGSERSNAWFSVGSLRGLLLGV